MDAERLEEIRAVATSGPVLDLLREASVGADEVNLIFELALAVAAGSYGVAGVRVTMPDGTIQIMSRAEWQRMPIDAMAQAKAEPLTPREFETARRENQS